MKEKDVPDPSPDCRLLDCLACYAVADRSRVLHRWSERDWAECIGQAERHGLSAYLSRRLKETDPAVTIPSAVLDRLRLAILTDASRSIRHFHGISRILGILKSAGIPVIVLKGAHLAESVYGDIALRPMGDLDLLLPADVIPEASERLLGAGFTPMNASASSWLEWTADEKQGFLRGAKHFFDLLHPVWRLKVDLHASLVRFSDPFTIDDAALWTRAVAARVAGADTLVLAPADALLYLCLHTSVVHRYRFGLRPLVDLHETLRRHANNLDWTEASARAREWGAERSVWLTLRICRDLLGAPVPETALKQLEPRTVRPGYRALAIRNIFSTNGNARVLPDELIRSWSAARFRDRLSALIRSFFPPARVMALMYPASPGSRRMALYYPVRWKDLFARWGRTFWALLIRRRQEGMRLAEEKNEVEFTDWLKRKESQRSTF
ncbi:nucleotidyltransferase family protein [bacterium]|nr:nucleotidyltransferase family protein [bacterium]